MANAPKAAQVDVQVAVVGIYFGTTGKPAAGATGVAGTKFCNAPSATIASNGPISALLTALSAKASAGNIPNISAFGFDLGASDFLKTIFCKHDVPPKHNRAPGLYSVADSTHLGEINTNPKLAWQYYVYDKTFKQVEADGFSGRPVTAPVAGRGFQTGDLIVFRCVLIATGPIDFAPGAKLLTS